MGSWELQLLMRLLYMVFRLFTGGWNYCYWYDIEWYKAGKDGGVPSGVSIVFFFIVLAPLVGL
jgi:hypothetical protein